MCNHPGKPCIRPMALMCVRLTPRTYALAMIFGTVVTWLTSG